MTRTRRSNGFNLVAAAATVVFTAIIGVVAFIGHEQASTAAREVKSAHHMASLAQIQAVMKKAQEAQDEDH